MFADLRYRLRSLFQRSVVERDLDDEVRFHIERETEELVRNGLSREEADRRARLAFGGVERVKEDARDARGIGVLDVIGQDLRYAWRGVRARPGFTTAVAVTLGLGIGANTAMFGIVDRLLFRPPPYLTSADRVHRIFIRYLWNGQERTEGQYPYARYVDLATATRSFDRFAAFATRRAAVGTAEVAHEMEIATVSASFFGFFDARPVLGRFFGADEDRAPEGARVAVLAHAYWQSQYGGRADAMGQSLHVGPGVFTIVGVAPEDFVGVTEGPRPSVFIPITAFASMRSKSYHQEYNWTWFDILARRKPGVAVDQAQAEMTDAFRVSWENERAQSGRASWPNADSSRARAIVSSLHVARGPDASEDSRVVTWVLGVTFIVLLVACANVANLMLARAVSRRREIAVRLALGVTRRRLLQQLLTESALMAGIGAVVGLAVAQWGGKTLRALFLQDRGGSVFDDYRTMAFAAAVTLAVALLTGLAPAFHALRGDVAGALKAGTREGTYRRSRLRTGLLLFQGALSVVLLVGAGLFVRSLVNVRSMPMGYDLDPIVFLEVNTRGQPMPPAQSIPLMGRLIEALSATPGVRSAAPVASVPFYSSEGRGMPFVPGGDTARMRRAMPYLLQSASGSFFRTMGTRILRGRGITDADRATTLPVVVVNEAMAETLWPGEDPIGKRMRIGNDSMPFLTVVGVAENTHARRLRGAAENWYYLPLDLYLARYGEPNPYVFVRVEGRATDFTEMLRRRAQEIVPGTAYVTTRPMASFVSPQQRSWEFGATMFVAFGALALVLAAIGLYSVIAYAVAQRTHELGVRIALGASIGDVRRMIVGQGLAFAVAGVLLGSLIALWAGKWVEPLLFAQKARDPLVFAVVTAVLLVVAVVATLRPAMRATRVDPTVALRSD
jgi:putative ABC transport system permease protein